MSSRARCALRRPILALALLAGAIPAAVGAQQAPAAAPPRPAQELIDEALVTARREQKVVLVEFGASWCGWCRKFEKFLDEPVVGKYMRDNFVVVHLVALESKDKKALENPGADVLLRNMGGTGGIPFFYMLDGTGKKIGDGNIMPGGGNVGHPATPEEVAAFDGLLARTAPRMTAAQRKEISAYLTAVQAGTAGR